MIHQGILDLPYLVFSIRRDKLVEDSIDTVSNSIENLLTFRLQQSSSMIQQSSKNNSELNLQEKRVSTLEV